MSTIEDIISKLKSDDMVVFDEGLCELYKNVSGLRYLDVKKYILNFKNLQLYLFNLYLSSELLFLKIRKFDYYLNYI